MGICKLVKNIAVYGGITVAGLYTLASCETKKQPPSSLERAAETGLKLTQDTLHYTTRGLEWLEDRVKEKRDYLRERK
jgi:hypothetical protein